MDRIEFFWCLKPNLTLFKMRVFGEGNNRGSSRGVLNRDETTGAWCFQTPCRDGVVIVGPCTDQ